MDGNKDRFKIIRTIYISLFVMTSCVYSGVERFGYVNLDDPAYVYSNDKIRHGFSFDGLLWAFSTLHGDVSYWHPVTWISHMTDCALFGVNPGAHHVTSLLIHICNTLLLFNILLSATNRVWPSFFASAILGVHPLHVESVAWISERKDVLCGLFFLLTVKSHLNYNRTKSGKDYALVLMYFALGLMSKPMIVTLPILLILIDFWPLERVRLNAWKRADASKSFDALRIVIIEKIPMVFLALIICGITIFAQKKLGAMQDLRATGLFDRIGNSFIAVAIYLWKTAFPYHLALFYPQRIWSIAQVYAAGMLIVGISLVTLWEFRIRPYLFVGWVWFLIALTPVIGWVQVGSQGYADRYTYIPMMGISIAIAWLGADVFNRSLELRRIGASIGGCILIVFMSVTTVQTGYWRDSFTAWAHASQVTQDSLFVQLSLARCGFEDKVYSEAIDHYRQALRYDPNNGDVYAEMGSVLDSLKNSKAAVNAFESALKFKTNNPLASLGLAQILCCDADSSLRDSSAALKHAHDACKLVGYDNPEALNVLAECYSSAGRFNEAIGTENLALRIASTSDQKERIPEFKRRLKLFQSHKGYLRDQDEKLSRSRK